MEGRDYRTPDWAENRTPAPTLWGRDQIQWLGETLAASTATFVHHRTETLAPFLARAQLKEAA